MFDRFYAEKLKKNLRHVQLNCMFQERQLNKNITLTRTLVLSLVTRETRDFIAPPDAIALWFSFTGVCASPAGTWEV